jgi:PEP-CTERM motif-containing protein
MKRLWLPAFCFFVIPYCLLADTVTYTASLDAVPLGSVPTGAFSFDFQSSSILAPSIGFPIDVTTQPGFTFVGTPGVGFNLQAVLLATNGVNTFFQATLLNNSNNETLVLNILPDPPSFLSADGTFPVLMFPNLIVPGNPNTITGNTGSGSLSITSSVPEPATAPLLIAGLVLMAWRFRRRFSRTV